MATRHCAGSLPDTVGTLTIQVADLNDVIKSEGNGGATQDLDALELITLARTYEPPA